ncbi:MAG: hypothetical protein ABI633_03460 [Burkholderiales bacterium]
MIERLFDLSPRVIARALGALTLMATVATAAHGAPFTPSSDDELVQRLPHRLDATARAQRTLAARHPEELRLATANARSAIERARRFGDPRELGIAQASLAHWWGLANPPPQVRLLRAIIRQSQHDFATALVDLDFLASDATPAVPLVVQAQAALTRASVLQVTGRLPDAQLACEALLEPRFASLGAGLTIPARACVAELRSLRGHARDAAIELAGLAREAGADGWLALLRAELAERVGDAVTARAQFREATALAGNAYTRGAYADWLLSQGQARETLALLDADDAAADADALLLRRAIALHRLHDARAPHLAETLAARFDAATQRGENFHAREQARFALDVLDQPAQALALARTNWQHQKEPADALLLVRAAVAAGDAAAAEPVYERVRDAGWSDVRLAAAKRGVQQ